MSFKDWVGHGGSNSTGIIGALSSVVVPLIFTLTAFAFFWGVINYFFLHGDEEEKRAAGRQFILWGIIGMAVLLSVWTFVNILLSTLGIAPSA